MKRKGHVSNTTKTGNLIDALKAAQSALNQIPRHKLNGEHVDSYAVAALVDSALKTFPGAVTQPDGLADKPAKGHAPNLETIKRAARGNDLALMECVLNSTGERVAVLCAVARQGGEYNFSPFAVMMNGNPYEMLTPPTT
jgi:hypothetical protein